MQVDLSLSGGLAPGLCSLVLLLSGRLAVLPRKRLLLRHQEGRTTAGEGGCGGRMFSLLQISDVWGWQ